MIELSQNIEFLLLENDCVIVPGLGGFIAHYQPARYEAAEHRFYPPVRTIGFNPQLILNDGLLAQLYMQRHHTDFPDATYRIQHAVEELKDVLFDEGRVQIAGVGELCFNMRHAYEFHPLTEGQKSPSLFGLDSFTLTPLGLKPRVEVPAATMAVLTPQGKAQRTDRLNDHRRWMSGRRWVSHIAAAAVAVMLFFALSSPVENTYVDNGNYASLGTHGLFEAIRSQSLIASVLNPSTDQDNKKSSSKKETNKTSKKESSKKSTSKNDKKDTSKDNKKEQNGLNGQNQNGQVPAQNGQNPAQNGQNQNAQTPVQNSQNQNGQNQNGQNQNGQKPAQNGQNQVPAQNQVPNNQPANQTVSATQVVTSAIYQLIVSSLTNLTDAQKELANFISKGYTNATIVEGNGRYRISLGEYSDVSTANKKLNELKKKDSSYNNAWLLKK
jgi:hypothetical protein